MIREDRKYLLSQQDQLIRQVLNSLSPWRPRSLVEALRRGLVPDRFKAEAREVLEWLELNCPTVAHTALPSRSESNDPSWDNTIRAYEEDR